MARVIYTGPLNPVIFARAKKEAEKAERINGYRPRVIKTPTHTVVYNKTGPEVKAVVMDMMAPITFSIPGSAIPVRPSFLHLHPDLPEKVHGRENNVSASGYTKKWGLVSDYIGVNYFGAPSQIPPNKQGLLLQNDESTYLINSLVYNSTSKNTIPIAISDLWSGSDGPPPLEQLPYTFELQYPDDGKKFIHAGDVQISKTYHNSFATSSMKGNYSIEFEEYGDQFEEYNSGVDTSVNYSVSFSSIAHGSFLVCDIRECDFTKKIPFANSSSIAADVVTRFSFLYSLWVGSAFLSANPSGTRKSTIKSTSFNQEGQVVVSNGGVCFPALVSVIDHDTILSANVASSTAADYEITCRVKLNHCMSVNLSGDYYLSRETVNSEYNTTGYAYFGQGNNGFVLANTNTNFDKYVFAAGSIVDGGFIGVLIWAKVYEEYSMRVKTQYKADSVFSRSHLPYYFDIFSGEYSRFDAPFWEPPSTTTDGICLPHAWFFCRGNETRQTDFYPNNHNRLSIVIYPQGRHEFSVDEAEIVSVELNHTPRFVARPGGGIAFVMQSLFGGNKLVPYVVDGLVEERDEYGKPTGFYLAQDGAISGEFKAPTSGGDPVVSFKLSPRQAFDGYRTVTVETTTEREYGVQTTFEVQGSGGVRVQQPPSITLERINESVLAGQSTVFYVTATQIAVGSNLRYEVKRAGTVVSAGYIELGNCAGWVEFTAQFQPAAVPGDPVRYVLADSSAPSTTPSTVEFEFSIIHEQAPPPVTFSVKFAHELYASSTDRPAALPMPPLFFLQPLVSENGEDDFIAANYQTTLINRIYYSLQSKRVYVLFWDGQSCDVSGILKKNQESGQYEYNPDWKETSFDYPPAVDPYNIKGTLEPYVYAYMDYENNRNNGA